MIRIVALATVVSLVSSPVLAFAQECPPDGGAVSTVGDAVREADRFSSTTVRDAAGRIDHRASRDAAFRAAGDEWRMLTSLDKIHAAESLITGVPILGPILFIAAYVPSVVADTLDIGVSPVMLVKHGFMGAVHATAGLFQRRKVSPVRR